MDLQTGKTAPVTAFLWLHRTKQNMMHFSFFLLAKTYKIKAFKLDFSEKKTLVMCELKHHEFLLKAQSSDPVS